MNEILDLLPIPAERDLPAGQVDVRRSAIVAQIQADLAGEPAARRAIRVARAHISKGWLSLLGILALLVALVSVGISSAHRAPEKGAVAMLAVAGTAQAIAIAAPRSGWANSFAPGAARHLNRLHLAEVGAT